MACGDNKNGLHFREIGRIVIARWVNLLGFPIGFLDQELFLTLVELGGSFMNLTISGHHLEVTPALRSYVTTKLDRIMRHFDQVVDVKVLLTVEKQKEKERRQRAECNIHVKGSDMFAESSHEDLYAAVDELVDKLDRQVVRHKDRLQNHHHEAPKRLM